MNKDEIKSILATDCGSTTTKAILIEKRGDEYRLIVRGEAPTTVEAPAEDVTKGVLNAVTEVEELASEMDKGRQILDGENIIRPQKGKVGVDAYISTSSAGGGLQMMVAGVVKTMTAESAARAALGGGAIVMDVIANNDGRRPHEKIERIRHLRPDMILLSGGVDGGTTSHVAQLAEIIAAAEPKPRLGIGYKLPVIYAGNIKAREIVKERLEQKSALIITENLRPTLEEENLMPARHKIQDLFEEHVMSHAPGYNKLMEITYYIKDRKPERVKIMPTPAAVGSIIQRIAEKYKMQVVGVDIGGATTDIFSVFKGQDDKFVFNRSVSANLGMSYSISNVFAEAGLNNIMRWVPFDMDELDLRNRIKNKMIRPTTIPHLLKELIIEQACAREALRLSFEQHKQLAVGLKGIQQQRTISDTFSQEVTGQTLVDLMGLGLIIGSGGVLSHAPRRCQSAQMLIDAFLPEGITELAVDSIFMMPQLGVLATFHPEAATQVFEKDCMIRLGTCIAPCGLAKDGETIAEIKIYLVDKTEKIDVKFGEMYVIPLGVGQKTKVNIKPKKKFDVGYGPGESIEKELYGGVVGIIIDARGRPFTLLEDKSKRIDKLLKWIKTMNLYPEF